MVTSQKFVFYNNNLQVNSLKETIDIELAVYEVIKVVGGIPLFCEDHIERLNNSMKMSHIEDFIISKTDFLFQINAICKANNQYFGNVELRVSKLKDNKTNSFLGFISHKYPEPISYIEGVLTSLLIAERVLPNAKVKGSETRSKADSHLINTNIYEVLLVNNEGFITEGSRSNVFFIHGNLVYTAPKEFILPGITRKYAIKALEKLNIPLVEKLIDATQLNTIDAAFLCGTSPGILPIKQISNIAFDVQNKILRDCMLEFNSIVQDYLSKTVSIPH